MQIVDARKKAHRYVKGNLIVSRAPRPDPNERVMVRYPKRMGKMLLAPDVETLEEKLAKKIQAEARATRH